jgi:hypothetical protein
MKKNLRLTLALALGMATTTFAQDWSVDSRTRTNMSGDNDMFTTEQRARVGMTFGGEDWSVHASTNANYMLGVTESFNATVYEAYATANFMGYADVTIGRQALEYGSGNIIGSNQWSANGFTRDAATFDFDNDMADMSFIVQKLNDGVAYDGSSWGVNAAKEMAGIGFNVLYVSQSVNEVAESALGLDASYSVMGVDLGVSYNSLSSDLFPDADDMTMMEISASYSVSDDITVRASQTTYGVDGFGLEGSNLGGFSEGVSTGAAWASHGNMGFLAAGDEMMSFGGDYNMGNFTIGATMSTVTNDGNVDFERNVTEFNLGYAMGDNTSFGLKMATDDAGTGTDNKYMWATLNVGF